MKKNNEEDFKSEYYLLDNNWNVIKYCKEILGLCDRGREIDLITEKNKKEFAKLITERFQNLECFKEYDKSIIVVIVFMYHMNGTIRAYYSSFNKKGKLEMLPAECKKKRDFSVFHQLFQLLNTYYYALLVEREKGVWEIIKD